MSKLTVAVDFDGVLHRYITPWISAEVIPDAPVEGAIQWLNSLLKEFSVYIHTTRGQSAEGQRAVRHWLHQNGVSVGMNLVVTDKKLPAVMYVDDRGWRFDGVNFPSPSEIRTTKPWGKS